MFSVGDSTMSRCLDVRAAVNILLILENIICALVFHLKITWPIENKSIILWEETILFLLIAAL